MNCELNESHNWYESDYSDDMEIETLEPARLVDDYVYPSDGRRTFQESVLSSYSEHFEGEPISLPPKKVRMDQAHFRLSREDVESACSVALAYLGITDYWPRETLGLKWLMMSYFLDPKFRNQLPLDNEDEWINCRTFPSTNLHNWRKMHRVHAVVAEHLKHRGDTLPLSFTESLFTSGRVPRKERSALEKRLMGEFKLDAFYPLRLERLPLESIQQITSRIDELMKLQKAKLLEVE